MAGTTPVFKIGDCVRIHNYSLDLDGLSGTIVNITGGGSIGVDVGQVIRSNGFYDVTHNLDGALPSNTGRYFAPTHLELVEPGIPPLTIGPHKVTDVTRDSVKVGCQTVTREQVLAVQTAMDAAKPVFQKKVYSCGHTSICRTSPNIWQISRTGYESSGEFLTLDRNQLDDLRIAIDNAVRDV